MKNLNWLASGGIQVLARSMRKEVMPLTLKSFSSLDKPLLKTVRSRLIIPKTSR
jgi:hypothetical protein